MTIRLPPDNSLDRILSFFGKRRKIFIPNNLNHTKKQLGPYVTVQTRKEGFFKVLLRRDQ